MDGPYLQRETLRHRQGETRHSQGGPEPGLPLLSGKGALAEFPAHHLSGLLERVSCRVLRIGKADCASNPGPVFPSQMA